MEQFRVRHAEPGKERKILLPLALDACSLALLHILSQHLKGQVEKTGRTGFRLDILYLCPPSSCDHGTDHDPALERVKARYPEHEYHTITASDVFNIEELSVLFPDRKNDPSALHGDDAMSRILRDHTDSATSREDLRNILLRRLIVQAAADHECEAIIWKESTTQLAERTLSETAKGRGFSLPWLVADGPSPFGLPFSYPLRDLLTKEIEAYVSFIEPPLDMLQPKDETPPVSTKNTTIDRLIEQYFTSVEQEYPSIVANVVRTTAKLQPPDFAEIAQTCELCSIPLVDGQAPLKSRLCHGCVRTLRHAV
jgi:cytoplasmic tRNA 2-thiolation protein 2